MNLLGSQPLKGNLAESLTADMPKGASSKQALPSGNVVLSPPSDKDASVARGPSEFQSFLAADEARFRSPAAKPTKKVAPEASVALGVDSARLASAFAAFAVHATAASYAGPTADVEQGNALPSQSTELPDDATQRPLQTADLPVQVAALPARLPQLAQGTDTSTDEAGLSTQVTDSASHAVDPLALAPVAPRIVLSGAHVSESVAEVDPTEKALPAKGGDAEPVSPLGSAGASPSISPGGLSQSGAETAFALPSMPPPADEDAVSAYTMTKDGGLAPNPALPPSRISSEPTQDIAFSALAAPLRTETSSHALSAVDSPRPAGSTRLEDGSLVSRGGKVGAAETKDLATTGLRTPFLEKATEGSTEPQTFTVPEALPVGSKPETSVNPDASPSAERGPLASTTEKAARGSRTSDRPPVQSSQVSSAGPRPTSPADNAASVDTIAARPVVFADAPPGVNGLTLAKEMPAAPRALDATGASPEVPATASAVNQMVIRSTAHGVIELPELGRIQVSARSQDGDLGIRVTADRPETTTILMPHAEAMAAEVRTTGGSNVRVDVGSRDPTMASSTAGSGGGGQGAGHRGPAESRELDEVLEVGPPAVRPRVRIVL